MEAAPLRIQIIDGSSAELRAKSGPGSVLIFDLPEVHKDPDLVGSQAVSEAVFGQVRSPHQPPLATVQFPDPIVDIPLGPQLQRLVERTADQTRFFDGAFVFIRAIVASNIELFLLLVNVMRERLGVRIIFILPTINKSCE